CVPEPAWTLRLGSPPSVENSERRIVLAGSVASQRRMPRRPGPCWVFSIRLGSSYLPLGAVAVVEVMGEDAPVIRIHFPSFLLNATCNCEPLNAPCFTSFGAR